MKNLKTPEWQQRIIGIRSPGRGIHRREMATQFLYPPDVYGRQDHETRLRSHGGFRA
jgi:hypothetical protein